MDQDAKLMLKFAKGDISAFEQLLRKYKGSVINIAYHFIQNRAEAEDIAQEVFLKVYYSAKRYKPISKFSTWIYKITKNVCLNRLRAQKRFRTVSLDIPASSDEGRTTREVLNSKSVHPLENLEKMELKHLVKEAIDSLPPNQRMAIILQKYEGLSYKEISEIIGCSTSAVDALLQRAKQSLKKKLASYFWKEKK